MKHILLALILLKTTQFSFAQEKQTIEEYCRIKIYSVLGSEATITIDDGNGGDSFLSFGKRLRDSSNNVLKFKSHVDALNYMGKRGWKLIHAVSNSTDNSEYIYLFKREVKKEEAEVGYAKG